MSQGPDIVDDGLQAFKLEGLSNIAYIPDVVDASEELRILGEVERSPRTKWTQVGAAGACDRE